MYQYAYAIGSVIIFPLWLILFIFRKDLRREMLILGFFVGIFALLPEFLWFLKDYWDPLRYLTVFAYVWQEFLFGFLLGGIASVIYEFLFDKKERKGKIHWLHFFIPPLVVLASFGIFTNIFHINSMYSNIIGFCLLLLIIIVSRPDLLVDSLVSGITVGILCMTGYTVMFFFYPRLIADWWLLQNTSGILIRGIPLEEIVWFFMFGLVCGPMYEFWKRVKN